MSGTSGESANRSAPRWAAPLLALGMPAAALAALLSIVAAGVVFPLFDLTPLVVLGVASIARRWGAWSSRWFSAATVLSAVMILQWIAWDLWFVRALNVSTPYGLDQTLGRLLGLLSVWYLAEMGVLLVLFIGASVVALLRIRRQTSAESPPVVPRRGVDGS